MKLIIDGATDYAEVYDLKTDPNEKVNVAERNPAFVRDGQQRIAAWVQYQNNFYKRLLSGQEVKVGAHVSRPVPANLP